MSLRVRSERPVAGLTMILVVLATLLITVGDADACSVCYGDPESPMTKGMAAGIWVLLGCIFTLLAGFASMFLYWMSRSRRLSALELVGESATH